MSSNDIAIRLTNLSKCYEIYNTPRDRLKQFFMPQVQRMSGKPHKQYFREFWALKDLSFEIKKGETVGIIGRNGSGKSTLLEIICGTLTPTSGSVETRGRVAALLELGSGFNPEFTGRENVYMNAAVIGLSKEDVDERFDDIAAFADIGQFIEQPVKTYSSGMYVRLAFAVNILSDPEIMIVDEALAVGDMAFQAKCMTALTRIQDDGATVLFVSHDVGAVKSLCSRGVYLEHGTIKAIGKASDVAGMYIRTMREEMNGEQQKFIRESKTVESCEPSPKGEQAVTSGDVVFKRSEEFDKRVATFRYGSGGARITYAELLDEHYQPLASVEFDQKVNIVIHFETDREEELSCNYYIADDKRNLILGAGMRLAGQNLLKSKKNGRYTVIYKTTIPLCEGNYSIQLQLTQPVILDHTAEFLDVIDDAIVFRVSRRANSRVWARVYLPNSIQVIEA
jgi:lipopolysaccharide transport system ATP-binding protein